MTSLNNRKPTCRYYKACIIPFLFLNVYYFPHKVASDEKLLAKPHILTVIALHF